MDLSERVLQLPHSSGLSKNENCGDTALSLKCFGYGGSNTARYGSTENSLRTDFSHGPDDGCRLVLGLGPTPSAYCEDYYNLGVSKNKGSQGSSSQRESILKLGLPAGTTEAWSEVDCSLSTQTVVGMPIFDPVSADNSRLMITVADEGSTSAKRSGGCMPSLLLAPRMDTVVQLGSNQSQLNIRIPSSCTDLSAGAYSDQTTSTSSQQRINNPKQCKFAGCCKGARGASGLCIGHGGGQRCQKLGCNKGAESRTAFCKAHGGGKRCQHLGCTKSAEGKTDFCIAHGGGRRCGYLGGCTKAARGKSGFCIRHGGGKRCKMEGCTRSAEGHAGLCISHGGGRRCQHPDCSKGSQGSTMFCKAHGGGKRCIFAGCNKGAEGSTPLCKGHGGGKRCLFDGGGICPKSVHGGTNFCVAHGGGKRCVVPGCTKSARGRTDCCVRHGGGKRCKVQACEKSAQGNTDFCKAHGGGKRCSWGEGEGKCEKFARGKSGLCAAHSSIAQERETNKRGLLGPGLFHGLVSVSTTNNCSSSNVSECIDSVERPVKRQQLIPPQVLVPPSMKSLSSNEDIRVKQNNSYGYGVSGNGAYNFIIPEGRVHGGGLMSLLGGSLKNPIDRS